MSDESSIKRIAIVGLGPKGLYGLERVLANLAEAELKFLVEIHLFNKTDSFGTGDIYNTCQPTYLMMNYVNGHINMWSENAPKPVVPHPKSFTEWVAEHQEQFPNSNAYTFSSRATVGKYLSEGFQGLVDNCPENVDIIKHVGEVIAIVREGDEYNLHFINSIPAIPTKVEGIHDILICTGHPCVNDPDSTSEERYVDFIYPTDKRLASIASGSTVAIKGMGLTFIDAVLALTQGRQGQFSEDENGNLTYLRSGYEPKMIYPFSKSGLMMIPRGNTYGKPSYEPIYFCKNSFQYLETMSGKYDFERQLLPLIEQEFKAVYYSKLFAERGKKLLLSRDFSEVDFQIDQFHEAYPELKKFDFHQFLSGPLPSHDLHMNMLEYLQECIREAEIGEEISPYAAVASVWRHLSEDFNELYKFGGLKPQSQKVFLEKYAGHFNRISYGPPIENLKKIDAIAKAGLIDFSFSQNPTITKTSHYTLTANETSAEAEFLIEARIPKVQLHRYAGELYGKMLEEKLIHPYVNRLEGRLDFKPGCVSINEKGHPIDETGLANQSITFSGTPTEGLTYDNDTLSRKRNDFVSEWAKNLTK
ncbi:FAD-NAD(P)-binding protein [Algoriphagus ratkowskyi]|uniref:FAD-NAD(P)-binding protein n=1 Tax=Algoriphagus ratkowskyi TaxID=57028 RepID=A0A2W7RLN2_9BACT|nr:FAD/NAD(P)-binding protein [Algoriphagus ratkowskyi]PZX61294.1 FAD-NAD(P)-binding protein [Algoriphagus ratkowskyi]TXD79404.1 FAD/NAD(P)-binding protein [Algoriphagus ratkowskyi]